MEKNSTHDFYKDLLVHAGNAVAKQAAIRQLNSAGQPIAIPNAGKIISSAYEQLRNAAEYAEEHLVSQRAIRRYYYRNLFLSGRSNENIGEDLIIELSLAGYLSQRQFGSKGASAVSHLADDYFELYKKMIKDGVIGAKALDITLAVLSVKTENQLNPHAYHETAINFSYNFFLKTLPAKDFTKSKKEEDYYHTALFIATHQALLKSDIDVIRTAVLDSNDVKTHNIREYVRWNQLIDNIYFSDLTRQLKTVIIKNGAPFRVLKSMLEDQPDFAYKILPERQQFLQSYRHQIKKEYSQAEKRLDRGVKKSVIFIFLTKILVGVAIEIPFELLLYGEITYLPLIISLLFPPLYMASLRLGLKMPTSASANITEHFIDQLIYEDQPPKLFAYTRRRKQTPSINSFIYGILFLLPIGLTVWLLKTIGFNAVQMIMFFVFFSTATFLGFRLRGIVRELKIYSKQAGMFQIIADFFSLPFIILGQWLTNRYAKIDIIGKFLDIVIELPLKSVLRLIRQWLNFLQEKHDQIY